MTETPAHPTAPQPPAAGESEGIITTALLVGVGNAIEPFRSASPGTVTFYAAPAFRLIGYGIGDLTLGQLDAAASNFHLAISEIESVGAWVGWSHKRGRLGPDEAGLVVALIDMLAGRLDVSALTVRAEHTAAIRESLSALRCLTLAIAYADDDVNGAEAWLEAAKASALRAVDLTGGNPGADADADDQDADH